MPSSTSVLSFLFGHAHSRFIDVAVTEVAGRQSFVVRAALHKRHDKRCPECGKKAPGYDSGSKVPKRFRTLNVANMPCYIEARLVRVNCPQHGVRVQKVPFARPGARVTYSFENEVAFLAGACMMTFTAIANYIRCAWDTVDAVIKRVGTDLRGSRDRLDDVSRIGIDEIAYRKGHRYMTVVVNHDTGDIIWAKPGRDTATVAAFFEELGEQRTAKLTHISSDAASWIRKAVADNAPHATLCMDTFHVMQWASQTVDEVRRQVVGTYNLKSRHARWAVLKRPDVLNPDQRAWIATLMESNTPLAEAYQIKEQLRVALTETSNTDHAVSLLGGVITWANQARHPAVWKLAASLERVKPEIVNTLRHKLTNARVEAANSHIRVLTKTAYGLHSPEALIARIEITRAGHKLARSLPHAAETHPLCPG